MNQQREMLITCRDQFARYAQEHRNKVSGFKASIQELNPLFPHDEADREVQRLENLIQNTIRKAETNEQLVREIQAVLDQGGGDILSQTSCFTDIAYADGITPKSQQSQLGAHFEEVVEMIDEIASKDMATVHLLGNASHAVEALAKHLKESEPGLVYIENRLGFLDACCDQLVTVTIAARLYGMDPVRGLNEVNRSNYSKLVDGVMHKDPITGKWLKGPAYTKPDLKPYI